MLELANTGAMAFVPLIAADVVAVVRSPSRARADAVHLWYRLTHAAAGFGYPVGVPEA